MFHFFKSRQNEPNYGDKLDGSVLKVSKDLIRHWAYFSIWHSLVNRVHNDLWECNAKMCVGYMISLSSCHSHGKSGSICYLLADTFPFQQRFCDKQRAGWLHLWASPTAGLSTVKQPPRPTMTHAEITCHQYFSKVLRWGFVGCVLLLNLKPKWLLNLGTLSLCI